MVGAWRWAILESTPIWLVPGGGIYWSKKDPHRLIFPLMILRYYYRGVGHLRRLL